jgi:hypothetical protein
MPPSKTLALVAGLLVFACGGGPPPVTVPPDASVAVLETLCGDQTDNDGNGKTDCDDPNCQAIESTCKPYNPPVCSTQKDCGFIVDEIVTKVCVGDKCVAPGAAVPYGKYAGDPITANVLFNFTFKSTLTSGQKPQVVVARFIYPKKLDGTLLSCIDVVGKTADNTKNCVDQSTRARLDNNSSLNQVYRMLWPLQWGGCSGTQCSFSNNIATVPKGASYILYGEAWYGGRDTTDINNPTGQCAAYYCAEGQTVDADNAQYSFVFQ